MTDPRIAPERITKPIQLLAAWLAGLILVNGSFLTAATVLSEPSWAIALLVVASALNVPIFLACLFLLQTKFRPEMQEDSFYSKYLELNTGKIIKSTAAETAIQNLKVELAESNSRHLEMIGSLDTGLKDLARQFAEAAEGADKSQSHLKQLSEQATKAERTARDIEFSIRRSTESKWSLQVNDLSPNFSELKEALIRHGLTIDHTFGSTSAEPETPKILTVGFGLGVPVSKVRLVVSIAREFGFDHIHYTDEPLNINSVYVGSYIYRAPHVPQPVLISGEVLRTLDDPDADMISLARAIDDARYSSRD